MKYISVLYAILLTLLGARQYVPQYRALGFGNEIGTWAMYPFLLTEQIDCKLETEKSVIPIDCKQYLWHFSISSGHPYIDQCVIDEFARFISEQNKVSPGTVSLDLILFKNGKKWRTISSKI